MIKGWAAAGELGQRVRDGSVEAHLRRLGSSGFELSPLTSVVPAGVSSAVEIEGVSINLFMILTTHRPGPKEPQPMPRPST